MLHRLQTRWGRGRGWKGSVFAAAPLAVAPPVAALGPDFGCLWRTHALIFSQFSHILPLLPCLVESHVAPCLLLFQAPILAASGALAPRPPLARPLTPPQTTSLLDEPCHLLLFQVLILAASGACMLCIHAPPLRPLLMRSSQKTLSHLLLLQAPTLAAFSAFMP